MTLGASKVSGATLCSFMPRGVITFVRITGVYFDSLPVALVFLISWPSVQRIYTAHDGNPVVYRFDSTTYYTGVFAVCQNKINIFSLPAGDWLQAICVYDPFMPGLLNFIPFPVFCPLSLPRAD